MQNPFRKKEQPTKQKNNYINNEDICKSEKQEENNKEKVIHGRPQSFNNKDFEENSLQKLTIGDVKNKPLDFYKNPTLIGLVNIGAAYYMNAALQCFSQIEELTNYFLDENISGDKIRNNNIAKKNKNLPQLSPVYFELLKKLWDKNNIKGTYSPYKFKEILETMSPLFKFDQPRDSKDFINFLLN